MQDASSYYYELLYDFSQGLNLCGTTKDLYNGTVSETMARLNSELGFNTAGDTLNGHENNFLKAAKWWI